MARGGRRTGTPGTAYSNRSDLNERRPLPVQAAGGQAYGERAAQERAQRIVPLAAPPAAAAPAPSGGGGPAGLVPTPLDAPTARPGEPVTAGAPLGPGPGPEVLAAQGLGGEDLDELRVLYQRFPQYDELREIIEEIEQGGF